MAWRKVKVNVPALAWAGKRSSAMKAEAEENPFTGVISQALRLFDEINSQLRDLDQSGEIDLKQINEVKVALRESTVALQLVGEQIDTVVAEQEAADSGKDDAGQVAESELSELGRSTIAWFKDKVWKPLSVRTIFLVLVLTIIGCTYGTLRLNWPFEYALYWTITTTFTVGYGDAPVCGEAERIQSNYTAAQHGELERCHEVIDNATGSCGHRSLTDEAEFQIFAMLFASFSVFVMTALLAEYLEKLAQYERQRVALAKRTLLEAYIDGIDNPEAARQMFEVKRENQLTGADAHTTVAKMNKRKDSKHGRSSGAWGSVRKSVSTSSGDAPMLNADADADEAGSGSATGDTLTGFGQQIDEDNDTVLYNEADLFTDDDDYAHSPSCMERLKRLHGKLSYQFTKHPTIRQGFTLFLLGMVGVVFFALHYEETFMTAVYWVVITGLGVGFGDVHPRDTVGYVFSYFYIFVLVIYTYTFMATLSRRDSKVKHVLAQSLSSDLMTALDRDGDGTVSESEYLGSILVMLEKTDFDTVDLILKHFDLLDVNKDKVLDKQDILLAKQLARPDDIFQAAKDYRRSAAKSTSPTRQTSNVSNGSAGKKGRNSNGDSNVQISTNSAAGTMEV